MLIFYILVAKSPFKKPNPSAFVSLAKCLSAKMNTRLRQIEKYNANRKESKITAKTDKSEEKGRDNREASVTGH